MSDAAPFPRCLLVIDGDPGSEYPVPGHAYERLLVAMQTGSGVVEIDTLEGAALAFPASRLASVLYLTEAVHDRVLRERGEFGG